MNCRSKAKSPGGMLKTRAAARVFCGNGSGKPLAISHPHATFCDRTPELLRGAARSPNTGTNLIIRRQ